MLRNNMDAAEYKHIVLGLIFLKYISDAFEAKHAELAATTATEGADPEDPGKDGLLSMDGLPARDGNQSGARGFEAPGPQGLPALCRRLASPPRGWPLRGALAHRS